MRKENYEKNDILCRFSSQNNFKCINVDSLGIVKDPAEMEYVIGVDVGTGSVRAGLVDKSGNILKTNVEEITTWNPKPTYYQQSTNQIWEACCKVIRVKQSIFSALNFL